MSGWILEKPEYGVRFECDRLRRERHELIGELIVYCTMPGARTVNGSLSIADFNFSSARARQDRAKHLAERARTNGQIDWLSMLEEFCQGVFAREQQGDPAVDLRDVPRPSADEIQIMGFAFPRRHPSILFGDGGSAKSYTALRIAGELTRSGINVALFDWELCGEDHRDRLERLFGSQMPQITYCRCERALVYEADRLRRIVNEKKIHFAIYDSVAFACDGPPEAAEIAGKYFRALREIDCGSLHIAHSTKGENNDRKPFGSVFWYNGARCIWYVQASERVEDDSTLQLGFIQRKSNLGALRPSLSYQIEFGEGQTVFTRQNASDNSELAAKMSIRQRMYSLLKRGSMTMDEIAAALDAPAESIKTVAYRTKRDFIVLAGGRVGLVQRQ